MPSLSNHFRYQTDRFTAVLYSKKTGLALLVALVLVVQLVGVKNELLKEDYPREVAKYLSAEMNPGDDVYVSNYQQIVYYLLGMDVPTRFVHANLLFTGTVEVFNVNADEELKRIMGNSPEFVVVQKEEERMDQLMKDNYRLVKNFNKGKIRIYKQIKKYRAF